MFGAVYAVSRAEGASVLAAEQNISLVPLSRCSHRSKTSEARESECGSASFRDTIRDRPHVLDQGDTTVFGPLNHAG